MSELNSPEKDVCERCHGACVSEEDCDKNIRIAELEQQRVADSNHIAELEARPIRALNRLSQAMGNPAIGWNENESIEDGLVNEAIRRLQPQPETTATQCIYRSGCMNEQRCKAEGRCWHGASECPECDGKGCVECDGPDHRSASAPVAPTEADVMRLLLTERLGLHCDNPLPGQPYPEYACGKCWTCRTRAVLATPVRACAGMNCGSTDPRFHSGDCFDEHERITSVPPNHSPDTGNMVQRLLGAANIRVQHYEKALQTIAKECEWHRWANLARDALNADTPVAEPPRDFGAGYVCPMCGPDPQGADAHAQRFHTVEGLFGEPSGDQA